MKPAFSWLLCFFLILTACSAIEKTHNTYRSSSWSSSNPLSMPYEIRLAQFEKGNLVANHSFEDGKILSGDPAETFAIEGWETIGRSVQWIEQHSDSGAVKETNRGRRSIKITRKRATELDEAEGVISDYIAVIPGNYYFAYSIKLENILSNQYRLGVQLYDAIVVKALYFDENKQPVETEYLNPVNGGLIDNSDKSYSFTNYWRIDEFPWGRVRGRSYNYPFSEGDIPDRTRFVRLFFGLKGTGTMWLDDIDYRYSKWNFTALERFKPFFDKQLALEKRIIPSPKSFQEVGDIIYYDAGNPKSHPPVIVLPENPAPAERTAAGMLQKKINEVLNGLLPAEKNKDTEARVVEKDFNIEDVFEAKLILSIGRNKLHRKILPDLPLQTVRNKPQGYIIKAEKVGNSHVVFLMGDAAIGSYYASATALQLFENDRFVYHDALIVDYPDFLGRSYAVKSWTSKDQLQDDLNAVERMSLFKLNNVYFAYYRAKKDWYQPDALYKEGLRKAGNLFKDSGVMRLAVMLNPYSHLTMEPSAESLDEQTRYTWTHSSPVSFKMLRDVFKIGLEAGAETIMLMSDDFVPHTGTNRQNYSLYTMEDRRRFVNLQNAQAHIINNLKRWLDSEYPGTRLEFCPPWYSNEHIDRSDGKAESYFKELTFMIPQDVAVIWTGPTVRSLSIDMADLRRYSSLIGRWPMLWDNTLYARNLETKQYGGYTTYYPGKVRMCNLFEPYDTYLPDNFQKYNDGRRIYTNGDASTEVYRIKYATVADFAWNTAAYNPELSLWKVLCRTYGHACAKALIQFSDAYYGLFGVCLRMETKGATDEDVEKGHRFLSDLNNCLLDISQTLPAKHPLLKELERFRDKQDKRFEKLCQD